MTRQSIAGALVTLSLVMGISSWQAYGAGVPQQLDAKQLDAKQSVESSSSGVDGVYLYGQSPEPEQIGVAYTVFEIQDRRAVGAFYMPNSSFDCFHGELEANQLNLMIVNSYDQTRYPYAIALESGSNVASTQGGSIQEEGQSFELMGYHPIESISDSDRQILATCKADDPR